MKEVLEKALSIGGQSVLTDSEKLFRIVEDIAPERGDIVKWLRKNCDADSLKGIYRLSSQEPEAIEEWIQRINLEYTASSDQNADNSYNKAIIDKSDFTKCDACGSEWRTAVADREKISVCPFCHARLLSDEELSMSVSKAPSVDVRSGDVVSDSKSALQCIQHLADGSVIEGTKINGIWEGEFKKTLKDGSYWLGTYVSGEITGEVTFVDSEGYTTVGMWKNDNWNGRYQQENNDGSVTKGIYVSGIPHGPFIRTYKDGSVYKGTYVNGEVLGELTYRDEKGNVFNCNWSDGNWNGKGVYKSKFGELTGTWVDGEVSGKGIYRLISGQIYEGGIKNFRKNGRGIIKFPNMDLSIEGYFQDDISQGDVIIHFPDGAYYEGAWSGSIDGKGTFYSEKCSGFASINYVGYWKNGLPSGQNGILEVIPSQRAGIVYQGDFVFGTISGRGQLSNLNSYNHQESLINGEWDNNKIKNRLKSRTIKNSEYLLSVALNYIRGVTAIIR